MKSVKALQVMGLKAGASKAELKAAFRERAKVLHPDKGGSAEAFKELVAAYESLSGERAPVTVRGPILGKDSIYVEIRMEP